MFIWDFVADKILGQIVDWFYGQVVGFLGNFFAEMGNMGVELFEMSWVQSIVLFFSYLAWALYGTGLVVACFECGIEYSSGRGNIRETALNAIKGFMAVSLFTVVPVRLYELSVACCGTSIQPVLQMLEQTPQLDTVLLCLDNDEAGHQASRRMREQLEVRYSVECLIPENKDWNDDLTLSDENAQGFAMNELR